VFYGFVLLPQSREVVFGICVPLLPPGGLVFPSRAPLRPAGGVVLRFGEEVLGLGGAVFGGREGEP